MEAIASDAKTAQSCASSATGNDFILLMNPDAEQRERMKPGSRMPKWFGYPILKSGYNLHFTRSAKEIGAVLTQRRPIRPLALVFNISLREFLLLPLLRNRCRIVSLFQWRALETLPFLKRLIYRFILAASEQIIVYSRLQEEYVRGRFPRAQVRWMGLYTDTKFFQPRTETETPPHTQPFLLVPGNHKRDERVVFAVAEALRMTLVRFSSAPSVIQEYAARRSPYVTFLSNLPFERIRSLYQQAAAVLNIADDSEWPAGITTFCEALAMNAPIITPCGHSASGYEFEDGVKPYRNVKDPANSSEWCEATRALLRSPAGFNVNRTPRDLARKFCSLEAAIRNWSSLGSAPEAF